MVFALGVCGAVATSPGVAWADDTASVSGTSPGSNTQPASTDPNEKSTQEDPNTQPAGSTTSTTDPSTVVSTTTKKLPGLSSLSKTVTSIIGKVIVRSSGGAHTSGDDDVDPVLEDETPGATLPGVDEEALLENDVDEGPVERVLNVFLPQLPTKQNIVGQLPQSLGAQRGQQFTAAHVETMHVDGEHVDAAHVDDVVEDTEGQATVTLPPLPQLPFPNAESPEPVAKAWACLCSAVTKVAPLAQRITDAVNELLAPIIAGPDPGGTDTPSDSPLNWAVLAWVRKQAEEVLGSPQVTSIMQTAQAYGSQAWQQFLLSCAGPTEGLPTEFERTVLESDLTEPVDFAFLPDGRILIAEKSGALKVYEEGKPTTTLVTLPVETDFESGIGGIEVDPNYATNHYVYVSYTNGTNEDMLSRFTIEGNSAQIIASEKILIRTNDPAGPIHHGGEIYYQDNPDATEPDFIYWAKGDNSVGKNAQDLTNVHGKIMRIYADGTIPEDNPYYNTAGARKEIYATGLRNPFRFTATPDGQILVADVGGAGWEELNILQKGGNYGWPAAEGTCVGCNYVNPVYAYPHSTQPAGTGSITSVLVYTGDTFGEEYQNKVFIADYTLGWIKVLDLGSDYDTLVTEQTFDGQAGTPVKLLQGPDGNIYQLNIYPGELSVIAPSDGNRAPKAVMTATPSNGYSPLTVNFSSQGSIDPDPGTALTYNWDFGDGTTSTQANPTKTYSTNGKYVVTLVVSDGQEEGKATQNVTVGSTPPKIDTFNVTSSSGGGKYNAGDVISFNATATDRDLPDSAGLPDSAYKWNVIFHHADHIHPADSAIVGKSGSITVPRDPHNSADTWYEVQLTVTDSSGLSTTESRVIKPNVVTQTFKASDPQAKFTIDGKEYTGSYTEQSVVGVDREIGAPTTQTVGNRTLRFNRWEDGGDRIHVIRTPDGATTYTVYFDEVPSAV